MERGRRTIMVADDDPAFLDTATGVLERAGYRVVRAQDGQHALQEALSRKVDLIVLDVSMPQLGGVQACHCLKAMPKTAKIPVILTTSKKDPQARTLAEHMQGSVKVLRKPFEEDELLSTVSGCLARPKSLI
ncbi:response regulator [Rubrobacter indicoceani]|uniref:response regulator n=1 Tax=Rubrobacter indicoceani TaxID=2051957 RepID=UPI0013C48551|nr:response regulator [Rubrobacter indicoceani]